MGTWEDHDLDTAVGHILNNMPVIDRVDDMDRPFITSYQIAI